MWTPTRLCGTGWRCWHYFEKGTTLLYSGQVRSRHRVDLFNADDAYCDMRLDLQPYLKQLRQMKRTLPMSACFQLEAVENGLWWAAMTGRRPVFGASFDLKSAGGSVAVDLPDGTYTDRITGRGHRLRRRLRFGAGPGGHRLICPIGTKAGTASRQNWRI